MIPVEVVKFIMLFGKEGLSEALSYFIKSIDGDRFYFTDELVEDKFISVEFGEELYKLSTKLKYDTVFEWYSLLKESDSK